MAGLWLQVALCVGESAAGRMRATTSPDELKLLKRYADGCPAPHGTELQEVMRASWARGDRVRDMALCMLCMGIIGVKLATQDCAGDLACWCTEG